MISILEIGFALSLPLLLLVYALTQPRAQPIRVRARDTQRRRR